MTGRGLAFVVILVGSIAMGLSPLRAEEPAEPRDGRDIASGRLIPTPGMAYADQPYPVLLADGNWLCMVSVGTLGEAVKGSENFTAVTTSPDRGRNWTPFVRCNRTYAVPLVTPAGRVYSLTPQQYTWSDDGGRTWSEPVAIEAFGIGEPENGPGHEGAGWTVSMPLVHEGRVYVSYAKIGLARPPRKTEVFLLVSDDLLTAKDPRAVTWRRLPPGERGLRGPDYEKPEHRSEEPHTVALSDGTLYTVWRTDQGHIGTSTSTDGGATWATPGYVRYAEGRPIKHPLACPSLWKTATGRYLLWHHNVGIDTKNPYGHRNPAWVSGGREVDGPEGHKTLAWSEPEVLLYTKASYQARLGGRISYPGLLQDDGRFFLFETQKKVARVHEIDPAILDAVWSQHEARGVPREGLALALDAEAIARGEAKMPALAPIDAGGGFTVDLTVRLDELAPGQVLLDSRDADGRGIRVATTEAGTLRLDLSDGGCSAAWDTDPGAIEAGRAHRVTFIVDGGPRIIAVVVDGRLLDGGTRRQYGWGRIGRYRGDRVSDVPADMTGGPSLRLAPSLRGDLSSVQLYTRPLLVSEAVGLHRTSVN